MNHHAKRIDVKTWRKVANFDELFATEKTPDPPLKQRVAEYAKTCLTKNKLKSCLHSNFPFINGLKNYQILKDLPCDVVSGITVGIMQIPQGMSYILLVCVLSIMSLLPRSYTLPNVHQSIICSFLMMKRSSR